MLPEADPLGRYRLWSLYDMLRIIVPDLIAALSDLCAKGVLIGAITDAAEDDLARMRADIGKDIADVAAQLDKTIPASPTLRKKFGRLVKVVEAPRFDQAKVHTLVGEFIHDLLNDWRGDGFLMIPADRRLFYDQPEPAFGPNVASRYQKANKDIAAANRCYALDEWTACVFHSMRVLEIGLRDLAKRLDIRIVNRKGKETHLESAQWHDILTEMAKVITAMSGATPSKKRKQEYYSQIALEFTHFKDAWRNHVMHAREPYDEREALMVLGAVNRFMVRLAAGAPR